jgi:hypothetical protein
MAVRHDDLSPEEAARQEALDRSWDAAQQALADASIRSYLEASIDRINRSSAPPITVDEFLAQTNPSTE